MHFRFYRGSRAGFLNLSKVDIRTRQVFVGEGTCTLPGVSQHPPWWDTFRETSSWLRTTELEWMQVFLCLPGENCSSPGLRGGGRAEMSRRDCRDQEMNSSVLGWTDPSQWSSPQSSLCFPPSTFHLLWRKNLVLCWGYSLLDGKRIVCGI